MHASTSNIRVVVRLPYNRPEEPVPDPPRVEWNPEKEQILWEVIAKSRAVEGAGTDWKGLAAHLKVPLPYLLFRAQTRYEEDLRGLQGIRGSLSPNVTSPYTQFANTTTLPGKQPAGVANGGEYFPRILTAERPGVPRRDSLRTEGLGNGDLRSSIVSPGGRPMGVRARLSSLGSVQAQARSRRLSSMSSPTAKKVLSSSTLTLQGPKKPREPLRRLSPASSHASPEDSTTPDADSEDEDELNDEERRAEEQETLQLKLQTLQKMMTIEALGLVSSPTRASASHYSDKGKGREQHRNRNRPLSSSSASSSRHAQLQLNMTRRYSASQTPSHHSLSSVDANSPQGSIPSIPSPPPEPTGRPSTRQVPLSRHLSQPSKSTSPPAVSPKSAWGHTAAAQTNQGAHAVGRTKVGGGRVSERGSEMGSEASSFSDLSDASLSASALESALMSNIRGGGSRISSFARSQLSRGVR